MARLPFWVLLASRPEGRKGRLQASRTSKRWKGEAPQNSEVQVLASVCFDLSAEALGKHSQLRASFLSVEINVMRCGDVRGICEVARAQEQGRAPGRFHRTSVEMAPDLRGKSYHS